MGLFSFLFSKHKLLRTTYEAETEHIPDVPMYVVFSLGTNKEPLEKQLSIRMEIDWFRGYCLKS